MLDLYEEKFPYDYTREEIIKGLNDFSKADDEPNPICFRNKQWDLIKLDMIDFVSQTFTPAPRKPNAGAGDFYTKPQ